MGGSDEAVARVRCRPVVAGQGIALRCTANDLHASLNHLVQQRALDEVRIAGYSLALPILRAFAAEIMLKAIAFKRTRRYARNHDLLKLYDALDDDVPAYD